jgi:hypothetical protein
MKLSNPLLSVAATLPFAFGAARAQVIFTDTFDSGIGNWYISSTINLESAVGKRMRGASRVK